MTSSGLENLPSLISAASQRALACGALQPIASTVERVTDGGVNFIVRTTSPPEPPPANARFADPPPNPFLPYHPAVFVVELSPTHVCLLNKFSVVPGHVLVVTRDFQPQESPLTIEDFRAWFDCFAQIDGVGFYNSGPLAGASQPHKHLQLVPFPLAGDANAIEPPMAALWETIASRDCEIASCPSWPIRHRLARLPTDGSEPKRAVDIYHQMLGELLPAAYNLILTRRWLAMIPRQRDSFASIPMNGLSYARAILARGKQQRQSLLAAGPMAALRHGAFIV